MSPTDISEKGLETLIVASLVNEAGYELGSNEDYSREHVIDLVRLFLGGEDRFRKVITDDIPAKVAADQAYQNAMKNSSMSAARLEHDRALEKVVIDMLSDHTELFKQFSDNPDFKKWLADTIFGVTYEEAY